MDRRQERPQPHYYARPDVDIPKDGRYFIPRGKNERRYDEVLFRGRHVDHLPWGPYNHPVNLDGLPLQNVQVTIESLYHVTHQRNFDDIFQRGRNPFFLLEPHEKKGKHGYGIFNGSPLGHSFSALHNDDPPTEDSQYQYHSPEGVPLLPGSYIWWSVGIEPHQFEVPDRFQASEIFANGESLYGSKKISGNFKDVLVAYQECFEDLSPIELRIGGTLRYRHEVCHIVIVNAAIPDHKDVRNVNYPIWNDADGVQVEICYDQDNKVSHAEASFIVKNGLKDQDQGLSWDHVVFAFYFPRSKSKMVCRKPPFDDTEVPHSRDKCLRSRRDRPRKPLCPDDDGYYSP